MTKHDNMCVRCLERPRAAMSGGRWWCVFKVLVRDVRA